MNYKIIFSSVLTASLLTVVENAQSSFGSDEVFEQTIVSDGASVSRDFSDINVCNDLIANSQTQRTMNVALQAETTSKEAILEALPHHIDRFNFDDLRTENSMDYQGLKWTLIDGKVPSNFRKKVSNFFHSSGGLHFKDIQNEQDHAIVTYSYKKSIFSKKAREFSVRTPLQAETVLQHKIQALSDRERRVSYNKTLALDVEGLSQRLSDLSLDETVSNEGCNRATEILDMAQNQLIDAKEILQNLHENRENSRTSYSQYIAFAWNLYQFKNTVQGELERLISYLQLEKNPTILQWSLESGERVINREYREELDLFSQYISGEAVSQVRDNHFQSLIEGDL